jgi:hypothetical protein
MTLNQMQQKFNLRLGFLEHSLQSLSQACVELSSLESNLSTGKHTEQMIRLLQSRSVAITSLLVIKGLIGEKVSA